LPTAYAGDLDRGPPSSIRDINPSAAANQELDHGRVAFGHSKNERSPTFCLQNEE
jgi:hypothetical protein